MRRTLVPIEGIDGEEMGVLVEALSAFEEARDFAANLETKGSTEGRVRRRQLFAEATIAARLIERITLVDVQSRSG